MKNVNIDTSTSVTMSPLEKYIAGVTLYYQTCHSQNRRSAFMTTGNKCPMLLTHIEPTINETNVILQPGLNGAHQNGFN